MVEASLGEQPTIRLVGWDRSFRPRRHLLILVPLDAIVSARGLGTSKVGNWFHRPVTPRTERSTIQA